MMMMTKVMMQKTMTVMLLLQDGMGLWGLNKENGLRVDGAEPLLRKHKSPHLAMPILHKNCPPCFSAFFLSVSH